MATDNGLNNIIRLISMITKMKINLTISEI